MEAGFERMDDIFLYFSGANLFKNVVASVQRASSYIRRHRAAFGVIRTAIELMPGAMAVFDALT
jgi:hypothetical protein